jgi:hypothetical protein
MLILLQLNYYLPLPLFCHSTLILESETQNKTTVLSRFRCRTLSSHFLCRSFVLSRSLLFSKSSTYVCCKFSTYWGELFCLICCTFSVALSLSYFRAVALTFVCRALSLSRFLYRTHVLSRSRSIYYTTLHYTTLHYTTLYYTILYYTILYYTTLHYTMLIVCCVSLCFVFCALCSVLCALCFVFCVLCFVVLKISHTHTHTLLLLFSSYSACQTA